MESARPLFVECMKCKARWQAGELPLNISKFAASLETMKCPHCGTGSDNIGMCASEGKHAVTQPRGPQKASDQ